MTPIRPSFNRAGYIATLRSTKIREIDGLAILVLIAEKCDDNRMVPRRHFTAPDIARLTGIERTTAYRRLAKLRLKSLITVTRNKRTSCYQLAPETKLQKFL